MGKLRSGVGLGVTGILLVWLHSYVSNVLLFVASAWFIWLGAMQILSFIRLIAGPRTFERRLYLHSGFANPWEMVLITAGMVAFSFVAYFGYASYEHHWFLLVHGVWWSAVTLVVLQKAITASQ